MLSLRPYSNPGYMEATWDEEYAGMCAGNLFLIFTWGDTTPYLEIPADCPGSVGKMTYFAHPGMGLSIAEANNWMIPKSAKNPEAAFLFAQWINRKDIQARTMPAGGNPTRSDVYEMPEWERSGLGQHPARPALSLARRERQAVGTAESADLACLDGDLDGRALQRWGGKPGCGDRHRQHRGAHARRG